MSLKMNILQISLWLEGLYFCRIILSYFVKLKGSKDIKYFLIPSKKLTSLIDIFK